MRVYECYSVYHSLFLCYVYICALNRVWFFSHSVITIIITPPRLLCRHGGHDAPLLLGLLLLIDVVVHEHRMYGTCSNCLVVPMELVCLWGPYFCGGPACLCLLRLQLLLTCECISCSTYSTGSHGPCTPQWSVVIR